MVLVSIIHAADASRTLNYKLHESISRDLKLLAREKRAEKKAKSGRPGRSRRPAAAAERIAGSSSAQDDDGET